jgi:hypothetical protein
MNGLMGLLGWTLGGPEIVVLLIVIGFPVALILVILKVVNSNKKKDE